MAITTTAVGTNIHPADIVAAAGLSPGAFEFLTVNRITAYTLAGNAGTGVASQIGLRLTTRILQGVTVGGDADSLPDREFSDFGITNAANACVSVAINPKDQGFIDSTAVIARAAICNIQCLNNSGIGMVGAVLVDMIVQFKNSPTLVRERQAIGAVQLLWNQPEPTDPQAEPLREDECN